jgi:hypothetical protein
MPPWPVAVDGRFHRQAWADEIHPVSAGLRSPGRVPPSRPSGSSQSHSRPKWQRLRRRPGFRLLEDDQGALEGADERGASPFATWSPTRHQMAVHDLRERPRDGEARLRGSRTVPARPQGQRRDPARPVLQPSEQSAALLEPAVNFRKHQPSVMIDRGMNDQIFPAAGNKSYRRNLKNIDFHFARCRPFRPGDQRGRDRRADEGVPRQPRDREVSRDEHAEDVDRFAWRHRVAIDRMTPNTLVFNLAQRASVWSAGAPFGEELSNWRRSDRSPRHSHVLDSYL